MKDMNREAKPERCCSDSLVDDLIRSAKRAGKTSARMPTSYPGPLARDLDDKHYVIQQRWNGIMQELALKGYRVSWDHIETYRQESGGKTEYFTTITISWERND